jgi:hypothetical protein
MKARSLLVSLVFLGVAGCAGSTTPPAPSAAQPVEFSSSATGPAHMYVSEGPAHVIVRFPLHNGIPSQRPDAVIRGLADPRGIAIGPDGRLYVVDRGLGELLIYAPAPGNGSKPVLARSIKRAAGVGAVTVDPRGNIYVAWASPCTTEGFYCAYAFAYSPYPSGVHLISTLAFGGGGGGVNTAAIRSMAVNPAQVLVEESAGQSLVVYTHAPKVTSFYPIFCGAVNNAGDVWGPARALYETDLGGSQPATKPQIVVVPDYRKGSIDNCPAFYTIVPATVPLKDPFAIVVNAGRIYVTSALNARIGSALVFVFDPAKAGRQTPLGVAVADAQGDCDRSLRTARNAEICAGTLWFGVRGCAADCDAGGGRSGCCHADARAAMDRRL